VIRGAGGADTLIGFKGSDVLKGDGGADVLVGNRGGDKLVGGKGNDTLLGGSGRDKLEGGRGNDTLTGGTGADRFVFKDGFGQDVITDFEAGGLSLSSNDGDAKLTLGDNVLIVEGATLEDVDYFGFPV